jgi:P27 family predicted phage terminase small subunit
MPDPPEFLTGYALEEWHRKAPDLHQVGILTVVDDAMLAAYCTAYALWRTAQEQLNRLAEADPTTGGLLMKSPSGYPVHNPLLSIANKARAEMARYAAELGLTPSGRTRVQTEALNPDPRIAKYGL